MPHKRKTQKRGGFLGEIIQEAIVPFGIFGLQQNYNPKSKRGGKSKRRSRSGGKRSRRH